MKPRVLIVDDSALVLDALRLLLEETGHVVHSACTVRDAVDTARASTPDIMLLDLTLRREDGLDALLELARTGDAPPVTVAITGHDDEAVRARCLDAGCREVLVKPIAALELPGRIKQWLER